MITNINEFKKSITEQVVNNTGENKFEKSTIGRWYYWILIEPGNESILEEHLINYTMMKINESQKDLLVDKYFDKSKTIYIVGVGPRWTSEQLGWWRKDFEKDIESVDINIETLYHSMYHHKK